jgi:hypothetical protein
MHWMNMNPKLRQLFHSCAAASFDKQCYLDELVGQLDWNFNLSMGVLSFGRHLQWSTQILATESEKDRNWLWGWANPTEGISPHSLEMSWSLKRLGTEHEIPELAQPRITLNDTDPHALALIASGICDANAYFRAPYPGGGLFLLIKDQRFRREISNRVERILTIFPQTISSLEISDHRTALEHYLRFYGFEPASKGDSLSAEQNGQRLLTATFDEFNRLARLEGTFEH